MRCGRLVACLVLSACGGRTGSDGAESGAGASDSADASGTADGSGSTDSVDGDGTDTDTDDPEGDGCPPASQLVLHALTLDGGPANLAMAFDLELPCTVSSIGGTLEDGAVIALDCLDGETPVVHELEVQMSSDPPAPMPFVLDQDVQLSARYRGFGVGGFALVVRDPTDRVLLAWYDATGFPGDDPDAPTLEFFAPLTLAIVDGLCDTVYEPGSFLPNICAYYRNVGVEFRQQPQTEPAVVLPGWSAAVPGEPAGYAALSHAYLFIECEEDRQGGFRFVFAAAGR